MWSSILWHCSSFFISMRLKEASLLSAFRCADAGRFGRSRNWINGTGIKRRAERSGFKRWEGLWIWTCRRSLSNMERLLVWDRKNKICIDLRYGLFSSPLIHFCSSLGLEFCGRCIKPLTNIDRIPSHLSRQAVFPRKRAELHPVEPEDWICSWLDSMWNLGVVAAVAFVHWCRGPTNRLR